MRSDIVSYLWEDNLRTSSRGNEDACNSPLVWVINPFQCNVLFILEETVEFWSESVESEFCEDELNIGANQGTIT